jgi:two-component system, NarL family, nitrate/nitrite response regulator NarL
MALLETPIRLDGKLSAQMDSSTGNQAKPIRAIVADEDSTFRAALCKLFESERDIRIVAEASDVPRAVELASKLEPDVLLLDFALCQKPSVTESDAVRLSLAEFRILVMVGNPKETDVVDAFCLGARGIVPKGSEVRLWSKSIRKVVGGEYWLGSESAAILIKALRALLPKNADGVRPQSFGLTRRELEIVERIARGRSNREVGLEFSICERTVKHHLTNIYNKLGVSSRLALALFARDNRILVASQESSLQRFGVHDSAAFTREL